MGLYQIAAQDFAFRVQGVAGLFLEENRNVLILQLPDVLQAVEGIAGKSADRLGNYHIYFIRLFDTM